MSDTYLPVVVPTSRRSAIITRVGLRKNRGQEATIGRRIGYITEGEREGFCLSSLDEDDDGVCLAIGSYDKDHRIRNMDKIKLHGRTYQVSI